MLYNFVYDPLYSLWYSVKEFFRDLADMVEEIKKPRTWLSVLYIVSFYSIFYKKWTLFRWLIPCIIIVYIIRQRVDGRYRRDIKKKAFLTNNETILKEEYRKYQRDCYFSHKDNLSYELWKEHEINQLKNHKD